MYPFRIRPLVFVAFGWHFGDHFHVVGDGFGRRRLQGHWLMEEFTVLDPLPAVAHDGEGAAGVLRVGAGLGSR